MIGGDVEEEMSMELDSQLPVMSRTYMSSTATDCPGVIFLG